TSVAWVTGCSVIFFAACLHKSDQPLSRVTRIDFLQSLLGFRLEVVADGERISLPPLGEVGVGVAGTGAHGAHVDRFGEAQRQLALGILPALADDDLRGNIAPVDDDKIGHVPRPLLTTRALPERPEHRLLSDDAGTAKSDMVRCRKKQRAGRQAK